MSYIDYCIKNSIYENDDSGLLKPQKNIARDDYGIREFMQTIVDNFNSSEDCVRPEYEILKDRLNLSNEPSNSKFELCDELRYNGDSKQYFSIFLRPTNRIILSIEVKTNPDRFLVTKYSASKSSQTIGFSAQEIDNIESLISTIIGFLMSGPFQKSE